MPKLNRKSAKKSPIWDLYQDGISYSLLSKFVVDRERFRIYTVEGLRPCSRNEAMEFGTIFHKALEFNAQGMTSAQVNSALLKWASQGNVDRDLCLITSLLVPHYKKFWNQHTINYVDQERPFKIKHRLSNGIELTLLGRYDEIFERGGKLWLQENKTKTTIDESKIVLTLPFDLQTMLYAYTMQHHYGREVGGVLYNVIRKPSLRQGAKETERDFLNRLHDDISSNPEHYFKRYEIELVKQDINNFVRQTLDPLLHQVVLWWESIKSDPFNPWVSRDGEVNPHHWTRPFGIFDAMTIGKGDYFEYVTSGSTVGLERIETVFPELEGEQGQDLLKKSQKSPKPILVPPMV